MGSLDFFEPYFQEGYYQAIAVDESHDIIEAAANGDNVRSPVGQDRTCQKRMSATTTGLKFLLFLMKVITNCYVRT